MNLEKVSRARFEKTQHNPIVFKMYKVVKKIVKYSFYTFVVCMAYLGFMSWD